MLKHTAEFSVKKLTFIGIIKVNRAHYVGLHYIIQVYYYVNPVSQLWHAVISAPPPQENIFCVILL